jgi:creatinine amidohydrolase/Fe(II)-dependent formamide hydrolase-like protein
LLHPSPVKFKDYLSKLTTTGVGGDPTLATAEKGRHIFEAAVVALIDVARDLRDMERGTHVSLQAHPAR